MITEQIKSDKISKTEVETEVVWLKKCPKIGLLPFENSSKMHFLGS